MTAARLGLFVAGVFAPVVAIRLVAPLGPEGGRSDIGQFWYVGFFVAPVLALAALLIARSLQPLPRSFAWGIGAGSLPVFLMALVIARGMSG